MYFKRLEIHGFKAFADPVVIDFNEGITCIVGPNGSGKSNISDAIRWVLGEQSPKQLRGGKMEDVIFNGTATRRPRGMAEVTLVIDNTAHILDIEYSEVAVTRRMYRSGESEYLINGNTVRLRDIRELFMDTGIGVEGYSIIGQGKIADIVSNKPESRREIFEEAAGVVAYKTRKAEAERKLETTGQNLERIEDIVEELEGRVTVLEDESAKARRYLELRDEYKDLEVNITLKNIDNANSRAVKYSGDIEDLEGRIIESQAKRTAVDNELPEVEQKYTDLDEASTAARTELPDLASAISAAKQKSAFNAERLENIAADKKRTEDEIASLAEGIKTAEAEKTAKEEEKAGLSSGIEEAENEKKRRQEEYDKLTSASEGTNKFVDEGNDRLVELHSEAASKKSEAKSIDTYRVTLEDRRKILTEENAALGREIKAYGDRLKAAEKKSVTIASEQEERAEIRASKTKELIAKGNEIQVYRNKIDATRIDAGAKEARLKTIKEMEENYEGYSGAVRFIMQSGIRGIEGTAAEKLDVPDGMETAIETALGSARQNIIVADESCAKKAVASLKENKAGRLTFLPVDTIRYSKPDVESSVMIDAGFLGMADSIITCDPRYEKVFGYLLGRTAVTKDLDTAVRLSGISRAGLRFVSLEGDVVNASGAITGGRYKHQTAGILDRKKEKQRLASEIEKAYASIGDMERESAERTELTEKLRDELEKLAEEIKAGEIAASSLKPEIESLEVLISDAENKKSKNDKELETIAVDLTRTEDLTKNLLDGSRAAESEIEKVSSAIEAAMADYEQKKKDIDDALAALTESIVKANEWESRISAVDSILEMTCRNLESLEQQKADKEKHLATLCDEERSILENAGTPESGIEDLENKKKELEEKIGKLDAEKRIVNEKRSEMNRALRSLDSEIEAFKDQKYRLEIKAAQNETQLEHLKERLWNEFELSLAAAEELRHDGFVMSTSINKSREIRNEMRDLGDVNVGSIKEYEEVKERYTFLIDQRADVRQAVEELRSIISEMDRKITRRFKDNFESVKQNFERIFIELFGGGSAELSLSDELHPLESGIDINAQPPGKKLQNINLLSGGEKTMTAIALMFAVLCVQPTPFCILDEVEAALDDENISRFSDYLRNFDQTQFALITHQKATMTHADSLYGITMAEEGVSRVLSLRLGDPEADRFTE